VNASAPVREHLAAARAGTAICMRDELGFVRVSGRDAARLLQNVMTSDIDALGIGDAQYGLALTPKGRPVADAWIMRETDDAFVCACETVAEADLMAMLRRYRLASRADIASVTAELALLERPLAARAASGVASRSAPSGPACQPSAGAASGRSSSASSAVTDAMSAREASR
jgi:folate-binding Fe-S cluster repair protein YgfZ